MRVQFRISLLIVVAALMQGCASMMSLSYGADDLYQTDNRESVVASIDAHNEAMAARRAEYEAQMAQSERESEATPTYNSVLVTDYQTAYERRLYGFESTTYRLPASYYSMAASEAIHYASAYDPAFYNVMVSGDQVWVEPRYITSMFGAWGATNVTFGLYASPWMYGWSSYADPFYYAWWGYPRYSWYDWNWTMCYDPFYFGWGYHSPFYHSWGYYPFYPGYYPHYHHHHHHPGFGPRPPHHRPKHNPPGGRDNHNYGGTGARYTSPTTNRNYGAGASDGGSRPTYSGSKSTGIYNGTTTNGGNRSRVGATQNTRNERVTTTTQNRERSNNYRQGGNSGRSTTTTTTTIRSNSGSRSGGFSSSGGFGGGSSSGGSRSGGTTSTRR